MWKELTLRLTACEMGLFPGQIVLSEGMKELVRQPFGTNMPSAARLLIPADPRFNENPEVQYLDLHKGELAQYRFLEVWEKSCNTSITTTISSSTSTPQTPRNSANHLNNFPR